MLTMDNVVTMDNMLTMDNVVKEGGAVYHWKLIKHDLEIQKIHQVGHLIFPPKMNKKSKKRK